MWIDTIGIIGLDNILPNAAMLNLENSFFGIYFYLPPYYNIVYYLEICFVVIYSFHLKFYPFASFSLFNAI